jgi:hypothetical protein
VECEAPVVTEVPDVLPAGWSPLLLGSWPLPAASTWPLGTPRPVAEHWAALRRGESRRKGSDLLIHDGGPLGAPTRRPAGGMGIPAKEGTADVSEL